jgi:hypothetical protein
MQHKQFWEAGHRVFPLYGATDGDDAPLDEKEAYKKPRASGWQHSPVWSEEQFDLMQEMDQFATGYGVLCAGLLVVDVDARNGGIASLESLPIDLDDAGLVVATGSGGGSRHFYFRAPSGVAMVQHLPDYPGIDFKTSGFVVGPGSLHASGNRYTIIEGNVDDINDAPQALIDLLRKPERHRSEYNGAPVDLSHDDLADMLAHVDPDCDHETWVRCGMACHEASGGTAFGVWDEWSAKGAKYPGVEALSVRWHSFGKSANPVTVGTLIHYAEQNGWKQSVTFNPQEEWQEFEVIEEPLDTDHIDLLRPPGFAGEICQWVNDQCLYPREHLAVLGTLVALGNIFGLRYTDDINGVTTNLFGFGVADSGSGKDSVYAAFNKLMRAAALAPALHGMQKSEQEVIRNLVRHQPAFYNIDEFGIHLKKVVNAGEKGTASYLEGLIGILMNAYSKADEFLPISGDLKEAIQTDLRREIAKCKKAKEENEKGVDWDARIERAQRMLTQVDNGLEKPFVSVMGMTTPGTFDDLVTPDQATSGFIGRALIVRELDPNPDRKPNFRKKPLTDAVKGRLYQLAHGGNYSAAPERIEYYGDRVKISTDPAAMDALDRVYHTFWQYAEDQKEATGLTPIPRRGYEMVSKVSLILAVPSGVRTLEHVRWAYAFVRADIDQKLKLVVSNDQTYGADRVLMAKITKVIGKDHGETFGVIANRLRNYKKEDVRKALETMKDGGVAALEVTEHPRTKKPVERWRMV